MKPGTDVTEVLTDTVLAGASTLDHNSDTPSVTPTDEEYNDEFGSKRHNRDRWDDEDEEE